MKLIQHFDAFLRDMVNLNQSRIDRLNNHVAAIEEFVLDSEYRPKIQSFSPQGSWAHRTIIRPQNGKEFDADMVVYVEPVKGWSAEDYIEHLYAKFAVSPRYKDIVGANTRCVTLDYSGDFHLDLVPCVINEHFFSSDEYTVCNWMDNSHEPTDPEGYTDWLSERNERTGKNMLIKSTRLFKYLRDTKRRFSVKSVLLTTLLGNQVWVRDHFFNDITFADLPTAFRTLITRLDGLLQEHSAMPIVQNPVLETENFNRHWDQKKYDGFRRNINRYRQWVDDAYEERGRNESICKWRRVFGNDFAAGELMKKAS